MVQETITTGCRWTFYPRDQKQFGFTAVRDEKSGLTTFNIERINKTIEELNQELQKLEKDGGARPTISKLRAELKGLLKDKQTGLNTFHEQRENRTRNELKAELKNIVVLGNLLSDMQVEFIISREEIMDMDEEDYY